MTGSHDIFISYAREDAAVAERLAAALGAVGYSCWWDRNLVAGTHFLSETETQLKAAKAVLVLWSKTSIVSHWVADEATVGRDEGRLVALSIDGSTPPLGFRQFQATDFSAWQGGAAESPFRNLAAALQRLVPRPAAEAPGVVARRGNLPRRVEGLIGRERELQQISGSLATSPLVTLTGPGGIGKTRLAIEAASQAGGGHEDGVWLVELAPVADASSTVAAIARGIGFENRMVEVDDLVDHLRGWHALIVLDNCEHLVDAVSAVVEPVLQRCEHVKLLVTSQEILGVEGERVLRLRSLGEADAEGLFLRRARAADGEFAPTGEELQAVRRICATLDGVPLAIEMAAARAPALGCRALLAGLDDRFRVLSGGRRTALPRQRTLQATLDWSYGLLRPDEATVFRRLALFVGGFNLEAACAVASDAASDRTAVAEALASLTAKSLVSVDRSGAAARYRLLETMRHYAQQKLAESGETRSLERRHAEHHAASIREALEAYFGAALTDAEFFDRYVVELGNVERAIEWALGPEGDAGLGAAMIGDCIPLMLLSGRYRELVELQERVLPSVATLPSETGWRIRAGNAMAGFPLGRVSAERVAEVEREVPASARWATRAMAVIAGAMVAGLSSDMTTLRALDRPLQELSDDVGPRVRLWIEWALLLASAGAAGVARPERRAHTDSLVERSRSQGCGTFEFHGLAVGDSSELPWDSDFARARHRAVSLLEEGLRLGIRRCSFTSLASLASRTLVESTKAGDAPGTAELAALVRRILRSSGFTPVGIGPGLAAFALWDGRPEDAARLWLGTAHSRIARRITLSADPDLEARIAAALGEARFGALVRGATPLVSAQVFRLAFGTSEG